MKVANIIAAFILLAGCDGIFGNMLLIIGENVNKLNGVNLFRTTTRIS